ncbi:MAG: hypothetical protein P8Y14_26790 [Anaerolineales bacterium]|jgi:hypothetical protein
MQRYSIPALIILAIFSAFWAYTIIDTLLREFSQDITFIDLGVLYILGLITGLALGIALAIRRG